MFLLTEFDVNGETCMFAPAGGFFTNPEAGKSDMRIAYVLKAEDMKEFYSTREDKVLDTLANYEHETVFVKSEVNDYEVETLSIKANEETSDAMIVVHGIGSNYHEV